MQLTINAPVIGLLITVLVNFAALVWAASSFKSQLTQLSKSLDRLTDVLDRTGERVENHEYRLRVLEDRDGRRGAHP